ncbi:hypothetical protein BG004_004006 [Podila humilis]|nr:hypothetical protein BG004_004006 [Podila humilis]
MRFARTTQKYALTYAVILTLTLYTAISAYRRHIEEKTLVAFNDAEVVKLQYQHDNNDNNALRDPLLSTTGKRQIMTPNPISPTTASRKANAAFVMLVRNKDVHGARSAIRQVEDRFNRNFQYPYIFLNDQPFTQEFQDLVRALSKANMTFAQIPKEHWSYPNWIDQEQAATTRQQMQTQKVLYGWSESYRHMCRYQSGFFFQHEVMLPFDYYWRIEPDVKYSCDIDFDPFLYMQDNNKKYAFTISLYEYPETLRSLWKTTRDFMEMYPHHLAENNLLDFISDDEGESYNMCHFWSNFEIVDARWMRGERYQAFFNHLDQAGGFFYERWGDAPVHSIAAALLLPRDQVHFFREIGYYHRPFFNCPAEPHLRVKYREYSSCTKKFLELTGGERMVFPEELEDDY